MAHPSQALDHVIVPNFLFLLSFVELFHSHSPLRVWFPLRSSSCSGSTCSPDFCSPRSTVTSRCPLATVRFFWTIKTEKFHKSHLVRRWIRFRFILQFNSVLLIPSANYRTGKAEECGILPEAAQVELKLALESWLIVSLRGARLIGVIIENLFNDSI